MREFTEQELVRRAKAEEIRSLGMDPFGHRFDTNTNSKKLNEMYCDKTKEGSEGNEEKFIVAGRIMTKRRKAKAGFFYIFLLHQLDHEIFQAMVLKPLLNVYIHQL